MPDISDRPPSLAAALKSAQQQALRHSTATIGIAELGRLYQANNLLKQAEGCWNALLDRAPGDGHWSYFLADIARTRGDDKSMASWLKKTVKTTPTYATAWLKLAEWEFKSGQIEQAERDYRRRLELLPGDPYARLGLARIAIARNDRNKARHDLETLVKDQPAFYSANNLLAEMLAESGDVSGAAAQRKQGRDALRFRDAEDPWLDELKSRCFDVNQLCVWASIELSTNHGDHGKALLERAIQIAPTNPAGYTSLGQLQLKLRNAAAARDVFEKAVSLPNSPADAYAGLSDAYRDLNQPEKAAAAALQGTQRWPNDANLETSLGNALRATGRLDEAIAAYRRAVESAPNVAETVFNLGSALIARNQIDDAARSLKRALELKPTYAPALLALGRLALARGDLDEAGRCAQALYQANAQMPEAKELMAFWCLQAGAAAATAGEFDKAEQRLVEGIAASPDVPELHARLGVLYGQRGRATQALTELEKYHKLAPTEPMSSLFVGQAYMHLGRVTEARLFLLQGQQLARERGDSAVAGMCEQLLRTVGQ